MVDDTNVLIEIDGRVALVTINRPDKLNALDAQTRGELVDAFTEFQDDPEVRVIILTGAGEKAFVAGADIKEFEGRAPLDQFTVMKRRSVFQAADEFPKPVIAAINGFCLGGGLELAMACDIRIASASAKLGQPEVNLGIIPGGGGTQRLPRLVGLGNALRLLYTGQIIGAEEAQRIGLVEEVVEPDRLMDACSELAHAIAEKSPVALRLIKESVRASTRMPLDEGLRLETSLFGLAVSSEDKQEGVDAFINKRKPDFRGR